VLATKPAFVPGGVRWIGRVDASNPAAAKFAWSASGLAAVVRGSRVSVRLRTDGATSSVFFQPVIDGVEGARFQVPNGDPQVVVLAPSLPPGEHVVELYRETEGGFGVSTFEGFAEGVVVGAPPSSGRLIEIVGDSISAGYGDLGVEVHPPWDNSCSFSLETESAYQAYGPVMARALHAEASVVARSGWGAYRSGDGDTSHVLGAIYGNTLGTEGGHPWDFRRPADAIVVNLGTNDMGRGDPGRPFEDAYLALLRTVRAKNPKAWVFLTIGTMSAEPSLSQVRKHLDNVVTKLGDAKVTTVPLETQDATHTGCDYHPNAAEQRRMAGVLGDAVRAKLGW
jgi:lysophospholipase L1-like esterase